MEKNLANFEVDVNQQQTVEIVFLIFATLY